MHRRAWLISSLIAGVLVASELPAAAQDAAPPSAEGGVEVQSGEPMRRPAPLDRIVSLELRAVRLEAALEELDRQAKLGLTYSARSVPVDRVVTLRRASVTVREALAILLRDTDVVPTVTSAGKVALLKQERRSEGPPAAASVAIVGGQVTVAGTGEPIAGALVTVAGTSLSAVTRDSGYYIIRNVPRGERVVSVRFIGYRPVTRTVVVDSPLVRVDLALDPAPSRLAELVTTATGPQRRVELGNAITTIRVDSVLQTAPVTNVSDLLETRVPGLIAQPTSGAPGDPTRFRLRGVQSALRGNDPIIIVDGVRIYSEQSATRSGNLADLGPSFGDPGAQNSARNRENQGLVAAPSPLDQIDPNSIETIEVFNGASAATMYGADAANGVIVITTKKGRPGSARWNASFSQGWSVQPGDYPEGYFRWGHDPLGGPTRICPLRDHTCAQDSLVRFQVLNDPALSVYDVGRRSNVALGASGGSEALQYSVAGSFSDETGLLRLPQLEVDRYRADLGTEAPDWMRRPHHQTSWNATGGITARLGRSANLSFTTRVARQEQQRSSLENQVGSLAGTYADLVNGVFYRTQGGTADLRNRLIDREHYHRRSTASSVDFSSGVALSWNPLSWFTTTADAGLQAISRDDESLIPRGLTTSRDSGGLMARGTGRGVMSTVNLRGTFQVPLAGGVRLNTAVGTNYTATSTTDVMAQGFRLAEGVNSLNGAQEVFIGERRTATSTFGWYIEPSLALERLWLSTGLRLDGGSNYGARVKLAGFPKVSASYLISDEPFFPLKGLFSSLRLRAAYGQAGVQPGLTDRLRLYSRNGGWLDGVDGAGARLYRLGNTELRPERSTEIEGGIDADLFDNWLNISVTGYRTTRKDALMEVPVPPSVFGADVTVLKNVGVIQNSGVELALGLTPIRSDAVVWSANLNFSRNRNELVRLGHGVEPFVTTAGDWIRPGYPLFGRWTRPVVGYTDLDRDGIIRRDEVQLGDTLVYMGDALPNYNASLHTSLSLFRGAFTVNAAFNYQDDLTQVNTVAGDNSALSRALNDPSAPLGEQAAMAAMDDTNYGLMQTVSILRFNSVSVRYQVPTSVARALRVDDLSVAVQGTNLGLRTSYRGKDPQVNARPTGNGYLDAGGLPQPRDWSVRIDVRY